MRVTLTTMTAAKFEQNDVAAHELNVIQRHDIHSKHATKNIASIRRLLPRRVLGSPPSLSFLLERTLVSRERHSLSRSFDRFGQSAALPFERRCTWGIEGKRERGRITGTSMTE